MTKFNNITALIKERVERGDYALKGFPTEQELSREIGVARMTIQRAIRKLVDEKVLTREPNKRPRVHSRFMGPRCKQIALLGTAFPTPRMERWHMAIEQAALRRGWQTRVVSYHHVNDPVILQTLQVFDGIFVFHDDDLFPAMTQRFVDSPKPIVILEHDRSHDQLVSLRLSSGALQIACLTEHLQKLGHKVIDCVNIQKHTPGTRECLEHWSLWNQTHGQLGRLIDEPAATGQMPLPHARKVIEKLLDDGIEDATAWICTTYPAALAAMRVLHEKGIRVGKDLSLACCNSGNGEGEYFVPSLTFVREADPSGYLDVCLDWVEQDGQWQGPSLIQPSRVELFEGESTGLCLK